MAQVTTTRSYHVTAEEMWERVGHFDGLDTWHPTIASCEALDGGSRRELTTVDGAKIFETLTEEGDYTYAYTIDESPLPVADYHAELSVSDTGEESCSVLWTARFTAVGATDAEAEAVIEGIFESGLDAL